jgi:hypothetical protein
MEARLEQFKGIVRSRHVARQTADI